MIALEEICGYLPYGLKVEIEYYSGRKATFKVVTMSSTCCSGTITSANYNEIKPILRPLSDLTSEIEHNGEKFVPIVELYMMEDGFQLSKGEYDVRFEDGIIASLAHYITKDKMHGWQFNYLIPQQSFTLLNSDTRMPETISQIQLFKKLFEWHFDVSGLIERGDAIDINTI